MNNIEIERAENIIQHLNCTPVQKITLKALFRLDNFYLLADKLDAIVVRLYNSILYQLDNESRRN